VLVSLMSSARAASQAGGGLLPITIDALRAASRNANIWSDCRPRSSL
jgi:hypothetical protein